MNTNDADDAESASESGDDDTGSDNEAAMVADAPFPDAAPAPAGKLYKFGTPSPGEKPLRLAHEGHHKILARTQDGRLQYLPQGAWLLYTEWATAPRSLFAKKPLPEGHEVQVHRDGKCWRYKTSSAAPWINGGAGTLTSVGRRVFWVRGNYIYAAVLVCSAFWGERPLGNGNERYEAGHAHDVAPGVVPREAANQISWITTKQNYMDTLRAGAVERTGQQQAFWARPTDKAPATVLAAWDALGLVGVMRDGRVWVLFNSQQAAAEKLGLFRGDISAVLRGLLTRAGHYTFEWDTVAEPAERDRVQVDAKRDTFVTRDARLLQRKTRRNGQPVWTAFTLTPAASGYVRVKTPYAPLPGLHLFHRLIFRAFANDRIEAKIERARVRNAEIEVELEDASLRAEERAALVREKTGLTYKDFDIDHINGNRADNRLDNLEILTRIEHASKTRGTRIVETASAERGSTEIATFVTLTRAARSANTPAPSMWSRLKRGYVAVACEDGTVRHFHKG